MMKLSFRDIESPEDKLPPPYTCYLIDENGQIEVVFNFNDEADHAVAKAIWVSLEKGEPVPAVTEVGQLKMIRIDSAMLWANRNIQLDIGVPEIENFQVCVGSGGWPTPCEVGIYIDTVRNRTCIIDWPRPCKPVRFVCEHGEFLVHLDSATKEELSSPTDVKADFFRSNS